MFLRRAGAIRAGLSRLTTPSANADNAFGGDVKLLDHHTWYSGDSNKKSHNTRGRTAIGSPKL